MQNLARGLLLVALVCATSAGMAPAAATAAEALDLRVEAEDGFELAASYYPAGRPGPGVLLLHQCNADRSMWSDLGERLSGAGIHVLTLDYRGYGGSTGPRVRAFEALDRGAQAKIHAGDISKALAKLRTMEGVDAQRIATGGASCGGPRSIALAAETGGIRAMLFLSTYLGPPALETVGTALRDVPILAIAAESDGRTPSSLQQAFNLSRHPESRLLLYKGDAHGAPLFSQDPDLSRVILRWLGRMLQ